MNKLCYNCFSPYDDIYEICPNCGDIPSEYIPEPFQLIPGTVLARRYIVGKAIGMGGFGITYIAWDRQMENIVAIKEFYPGSLVNRSPGTKEVILPEGKRMAAFRYGFDNFIEEARSMVRFCSHKNIVNVFEYFEENNTAYLVMEFLDGLDVNDCMRQKGGKLDTETSIKIVLNIINALKEVHKSGIIHRDIAPDNIKICRNGKVKLFDFGAARFENNDKKTKILKPGFAPPEQYDSLSNQGPWTDIYALGATLYYMLTGIKPDESTNRKIKDELVEPRKINPEIPEYLSDTVMKAMALEVHLRFQNVEEFEKALKREKKVTSLVKEKRRKKRNRIIGLSAAMLVVAIVAGIFGIRYKSQKDYATLPSASIEIWYIDADGNGSTDPTDKQINEICTNFKETYAKGKTKINITFESCATQEELNRRLRATPDSEKPNLIITGSDEVSGDVSFKEIYDSIQNNQKYFNDNEYSEILFADQLCQDCDTLIPLGFKVGVVYGFYPSQEDEAADYTRSEWENDTIPRKTESLKEIFENPPEESFVYISDSSQIDSAAYYTNSITTDFNVFAYTEPYSFADINAYCGIFKSDDESENAVAFRFAQELFITEVQKMLFCYDHTVSPASIPLNQDAVKFWIEGDVPDKHRQMSFIIDTETMYCDTSKLKLNRKEVN